MKGLSELMVVRAQGRFIAIADALRGWWNVETVATIGRADSADAERSDSVAESGESTPVISLNAYLGGCNDVVDIPIHAPSRIARMTPSGEGGHVDARGYRPSTLVEIVERTRWSAVSELGHP